MEFKTCYRSKVQACSGLRLMAPARSLRLGERDCFWIRLECHQTDATVRSKEFVYDPGLGQGFNVQGFLKDERRTSNNDVAALRNIISIAFKNPISNLDIAAKRHKKHKNQISWLINSICYNEQESKFRLFTNPSTLIVETPIHPINLAILFDLFVVFVGQINLFQTVQSVMPWPPAIFFMI